MMRQLKLSFCYFKGLTLFKNYFELNKCNYKFFIKIKAILLSNRAGESINL